jgi:hypothetical protein
MTERLQCGDRPLVTDVGCWPPEAMFDCQAILQAEASAFSRWLVYNRSHFVEPR